MAAFKQGGELPPDAVILTADEALVHQLNEIHKWDKLSEVWPLRFGSSILGVAAAASGMYINSHYRRKLRLKKIGFFTTYLPIVALPTMAATFVHSVFITHDIIMKETPCPACLQTKASALQAFVGFVYPFVLAPLGSFMYATRHATYRLPDITSDFRGSFNIIKKFTKPIGLQLSVILTVQVLLASYMTYLEAKSYYIFQQRMLELEEEYEKYKANIQ